MVGPLFGADGLIRTNCCPQTPQLTGPRTYTPCRCSATQLAAVDYAGIPGYAGYLDQYAQILDVTKRLHVPHQYPAAIFESMDKGGWPALRFASDVLGYYAAEGSLTKDQEANYLAQVRAVIDAVASDESLSRAPTDHASWTFCVRLSRP
jgi:hypothetical protein